MQNHKAKSTRIRRDNYGTVRSVAAMEGLLLAEVGDGMVQFDVACDHSSFMNGTRIINDAITPGGSLRTGSKKTLAQGGNLARYGTLITDNASPERAAQELQRLLGNSNAKLKAGGTLLPPPGGPSLGDVQMEQAKSRARVEVDIVLKNNVLVQGTDVQGHAVVIVRKPTKKEGSIFLSGGKLRIVGYECIYDTRVTHTFYQCSASISNGGSYFDQEVAQEYLETPEGMYQFPFCMRLPLSEDKGCTKGLVRDLSGAAVRYIAIVSFKVKDAKSGKCSVAHFYRACEVWPRLDLAELLSPAPRPLRTTESKSLFMGGDGKLILTAGLVRLYWVSGQPCFVQLGVQNNTKKAVTCVTLTLLRNTVIFRPQPQLDVSLPGKARCDRDPDACQTATTTKVVAESILEAGDRATRGHASAKGWWAGVPPRTSLNFSHFINIPASEVSIPRSRLLEVEYILKVTLSAGTLLTTDVQVSLPVRLVNFLSLDPHIDSVIDPTLQQSGSLSERCQSYQASCGGKVLSSERTSNVEPLFEDTPPSNESSTVDLESISEASAVTPQSDNDAEVLDTVLLDDFLTADVTNEALDRATACARVDQVYAERAPRFADLCYTCLLDDRQTAEKEAVVQEEEELSSNEGHIKSCSTPVDESEPNSCITDTQTETTKKGRVPGPAAASFAHRVEGKLRAAHENKAVPTSLGPCSRQPSTDGASSTTPQETRDEPPSHTANNGLATADSQYVKIGQREICGKSGLVKSKIQELEQRIGTVGL